MTDQPVTTLPTRMPDTYLVIGAVALLVFVLSLLIDPGVFDVREVAVGDSIREVIDPDSFRRVPEAGGASLFSTDDRPGLFNALYEGLVSGSRMGGAVGIMAFILITGGSFGVVMASGAIHRGLGRIIAGQRLTGGAFIAVLFVIFSLSGAVFGMGEEVIPFVLMLLPVMLSMGYDRVSVVLVTYVATQIGFATSWMNPFSVAIAQGIADVPLLSGMPLRMGIWCLFTGLGLAFCLRYAGAHRVAPQAAGADEQTAPTLSLGDRLVLLALLGTVVWVSWGVIAQGYYLPEIATQFAILGVASGVIAVVFRLDGMTANSAMAAFRKGAADLLPAALVVGFARGIVYLMGGDDPATPSILNTLLHAGSVALAGLPDWLAAWFMLLGQSVFNFFVTSGSGQAALTMPLMAPMADLLGIERQVAVLAFQLGDGLTNMLVPTSAALMGCLGAAKLDWLDWVRAVARLYGWLLLPASVSVIGAVLFGYQ
ncbi:hypothetical protein A3709_09720 [Halioglobus sp. HI00S01]|uniref:putative basic amino acid antiporter YfcC n=1 Tax=Halioglobus sp. HI00S01 TaxID=1822214 RepID=UPI0007C24C67|nr:putative basic amino acid antiporter YfcC [Halioglobus sp. HI00S01]KZX53399.1 hypothetical protein A3709_09720 [Halioglobus sp. HI00S01]